MMGLLAPADVWISATWQDHKNRNPPSSEPGTDYATAHGTPLACAGDGWISDSKHDTSSATGRYLTVSLDDGRTVRYLHLSEIWVQDGWRVTRGQTLGRTGASGHSSEWGYGAHVHVTLWPGAIWAAPTIDFQLAVGDPDPEPEEPDMPLTDDEINRIAARTWNYSMGGSNGENDEDAVPTETAGERLRNIRRGTNGIKGRTERIEADTDALTSPSASPEGRLTGPAYLIGAFLGLIGLVEVLRFIADILV